ncbi:MAG: class I tRNA ligase family protein, partial [Woeseiaceae bacterium]|nr:class I tRNA ligase family protein [Woeseiaceae bacterium]
MSEKSRKILVTSALPYANGSIHMGHLVEYLQTDIWVRFQKLRGHDCIYVCASDAHGTPIMLKARELGISPEQLTEQVSAEFKRDFADFGVAFDNYHTTHSPENEALTVEMYEALKDKGDIYTKPVEQAYDETEGMFLPDRFVKGTCPTCKTEDQYGDACESCGATYSPGDLIDPVSVLSGTTPVTRTSEHYFFRLSQYGDKLRQWMLDANLGKNMLAKLEEWFEAGLQDWDISRDA